MTPRAGRKEELALVGVDLELRGKPAGGVGSVPVSGNKPLGASWPWPCAQTIETT
jgi:hypothetical protein